VTGFQVLTVTVKKYKGKMPLEISGSQEQNYKGIQHDKKPGIRQGQSGSPITPKTPATPSSQPGAIGTRKGGPSLHWTSPAMSGSLWHSCVLSD
jgi:hypothetical protein